jgi:hypothetical protein
MSMEDGNTVDIVSKYPFCGLQLGMRENITIPSLLTFGKDAFSARRLTRLACSVFSLASTSTLLDRPTNGRSEHT